MTYKYNFPPEMQAVIDNLKTNTVHLIYVNKETHQYTVSV